MCALSKFVLLLAICSCTGCSVTLTRNRFYIKSESLPMITNDPAYGTEKEINDRIMVNGSKIEYQRIYKF